MQNKSCPSCRQPFLSIEDDSIANHGLDIDFVPDMPWEDVHEVMGQHLNAVLRERMPIGQEVRAPDLFDARPRGEGDNTGAEFSGMYS